MQGVNHILRPGAGGGIEVDVDLVRAGEVVGRAAAAPEIAFDSVGVAELTHVITRVLLADLDAKRFVLRPCLGDGVAPLLHQGGVVPQDIRCVVIAQAVQTSVEHALCGNHGVVAGLDFLGNDVGQVGGIVDLRAGSPGHGGVAWPEDGVGPTTADPIEQHELLLEAGVAGAPVEGRVADWDVRVGFFEGLDGRDPRRVHPEQQRVRFGNGVHGI